jgi:hypothetical protein
MAPHAVPVESPVRAPTSHDIDGRGESLNARPDVSLQQMDKSMPIAIIGMGCRCAGDATNPENLWRMVSEAREAWSQMPESKYNADAFYHPDTARNGTVSVTILLLLMFNKINSPTFVAAITSKKIGLFSMLLFSI